MVSEKNLKPAIGRATGNNFASLVQRFKLSEKFNGFSRATQVLFARELELAAAPTCLGGHLLDEIRPSHIQEYLDVFSAKPGKQAMAKAAFKALEKWAIRRDYLMRQITIGVETGRPTGGHTPWSDDQVRLAEKHARPDIARAITLGAWTGQRGSDLVRMGPTDVERFNGMDGLRVVQQKTGREVWVPITPELAAAMATWERRPGPFLLRPDERPWQRQELTHAWTWERDHNVELGALSRAGLVLHGLRGHCCVRLSRAGLTDHQIGDLVGMSIPMVSRYTRKSSQRENAHAAVYQLFGASVNPARTRNH